MDPSGDNFRHFNDMWRFNMAKGEWEQITWKGSSPSPRSGHRMSLWKRKLVLFGGFYDTYRQTKFFDDLWFFDLQACEWSVLSLLWVV